MAEENGVAKNRIDVVQGLYEGIQHLIYVGDRKVSALLLINAVLISFSATWSLKEYALLTKMIILIGIALAILSTIMFLLAIIPRVAKKASTSVLHYEGILDLPRKKYIFKMLEIEDEDLTKEYLDTVYSLSSIQKRKNGYLMVGCYFLIISICLLGLSFIIHNF